MNSPKQRNDRMRHLFGNVDATELAKHLPSPAVQERKVSSGAVKSMDRAFVSIEEDNERLREQLVNAEAVVELDATHVVPSFVKDRLDLEGDPQFTVFVEALREAGQKLPILVRPLANKPGYYQVAYGHRRLRACQILGRRVKAIVRDLSDKELIIAQGVENTERANLSFIEQAFFALTLREKGFDRETIATALGRAEGQNLVYISMLTSVASALPHDLVRKIGPAPSVGRPKWEKLGSYFHDQKLATESGVNIERITSTGEWHSATSDEKFALLFNALTRKAVGTTGVEEIDLGGGLSISVKRTGRQTQLSIAEFKEPGLATWLLRKLPQLVQEFRDVTKEEKDSMG